MVGPLPTLTAGLESSSPTSDQHSSSLLLWMAVHSRRGCLPCGSLCLPLRIPDVGHIFTCLLAPCDFFGKVAICSGLFTLFALLLVCSVIVWLLSAQDCTNCSLIWFCLVRQYSLSYPYGYPVALLRSNYLDNGSRFKFHSERKTVCLLRNSPQQSSASSSLQSPPPGHNVERVSRVWQARASQDCCLEDRYVLEATQSTSEVLRWS